jgi:zinc protease
VARWQDWPAKQTQDRRARVEDRVPQARLYMVWNAPGRNHPDVDHLDLVSDVLATGKSSRLYKRLVYDERIATNVNASVDDREIASLFSIEVTAAPGADLAKVEKAVEEELARLLADGPTAAEVERAVNRNVAGFVRGAERIGGFGGKSDILARCQVYAGDPGCWKRQLASVRGATPAALGAAARAWLSSGRYTLEITPYPQVKAAAAGVSRGAPPRRPCSRRSSAPRWPTALS